jgi:hypothetical protein
LAEFLETEADEAAIPVNVGFLGGDGMPFESDGAAEGINEFGEFRLVMGGLLRRLRLKNREFGAHLDRFTGEGAVVRLEGAGLIDEGLPVEGWRPWDGEDIAGEDAGGIGCLAKLPVGDGGGTAKGIEIRLERPDRAARGMSRTKEREPQTGAGGWIYHKNPTIHVTPRPSAVPHIKTTMRGIF